MNESDDTVTAPAGGRRVALVFATSGHSGVDRVVANLLPVFGRSEHRFDLFVIRGHGPYTEALPDNVRLRRLPIAHRNLVPLFLVPYLRRVRPAALLTAGHPLNRAALFSRMLARVDTRIILRFGMSMEGKASRQGTRGHRRFVASVARWYRRAECIITPSRGVAAGIRRALGPHGPDPRVIANPIVSERLIAAASEPLDDPWCSGEGPPLILAAGSLEPRKDFATLIRAFARVRKRRDARLVILGRGAEQDRLTALAAELGVGAAVRFPGFDPNPYRWMARATVFALSSRHEGSGAVLVEALACGTPVVATDCPSGPSEILDNGRFGPLVPVGDPDALAEAIAAMLADPTSSALMQEAIEPFRIERSAAEYLNALGLEAGYGA